MADDQAIAGNELTQIQQILGLDATAAQTVIAAADQYKIEPSVLAELTAVEIARQERDAKNDQTKLAQITAASNIQILAQVKAQEIATEEAREAIAMMGGDPSKVTSPNLPADFKIPDYITRAHLGAGGSSLYAYATQFIGTHYVWGGTSLEHGCDCSGFVMGVFKQFGVQLDHSSQMQAQEIGRMMGQSPMKTSCNNINADQIPDNAVMTMGPKNGIGHVVIVTHNDKGERVVLQSMGGGVGVCEMPLDRFVAYLHRQPAERTLQVADFGPLMPNLNATATVKNNIVPSANTAIVSNTDYAPTPELLAKVKGWEGFVGTFDEKHNKEIGYGGTAMDPVWAPYAKPGMTISEPKAAELAAQSYANRGAEIARYFPDFKNLPKGFQFALEDFSYNAGGPKLKNSEIMHTLMNAHGDVNEWKRAAQMLANGPYTSHGVEMGGLKRRCHERSEIALDSLGGLHSTAQITNNAATNNLGNKTAHLSEAPKGNRIADPNQLAEQHMPKVHPVVYAATPSPAPQPSAG